MHEKALKTRVAVLGPEHLDMAATYGNISCVYESQGKYPEALKMHQKCLKIEEKIHGLEHLLVADTKVGELLNLFGPGRGIEVFFCRATLV